MESEKGFAFHDAGNDTGNMQAMVIEHLIPLIIRSLGEATNVAYVKSEYTLGKFEKPYGRLCFKLPGKDFYLIDFVKGAGKAKVFSKSEHDPFTNPNLRRYIEENKIRNLILTGITLTHCIDAAVNSAILIPDLNVVVPEDCVSYRTKRESDAQGILAGYSSPDNKRVMVVNSNQIIYKNG